VAAEEPVEGGCDVLTHEALGFGSYHRAHGVECEVGAGQVEHRAAGCVADIPVVVRPRQLNQRVTTLRGQRIVIDPKDLEDPHRLDPHQVVLGDIAGNREQKRGKQRSVVVLRNQ